MIYRENEYFIGFRYFELPELKFLIDAVQTANFISPKKTVELISKITMLASLNQGNQLKRSLLMNGKVKTGNEVVYYSVDVLFGAIQEQATVTFFLSTTPPIRRRCSSIRNRFMRFFPYDMVWCNNGYYVFRSSESHGKVVKFRVDWPCTSHPFSAPLSS